MRAIPSSGRLMLEARRSTGSLIVLVGVIVGSLAAVAIIAAKLTFEAPWNAYEQVRAEFQDAKGVFPGGDSVRIHGVVVGVVSKAALVGGYPVLTLDILKQYAPIYRNAQLRIRPVTPLDDLYVDVTDRGTPSAGVAGGSYVIPVSQTVTPVDISRILDTFNANTRDRLEIMLSELARGLPGGGTELRSAFAQLAPFLQVTDQATLVLRRHQQEVEQLVHNFGALSAALADRSRALDAFIRAGDSTMGELASRSSPLESALEQIAALMPTMRSSFASVQALTGTLDPALRSLAPVTSHLGEGLSALGRLGTEALPAIEALRPAVTDLRPMAAQLAPTSASLDAAFTRLEPEAPQLSHLVKDLVPCMTTIRDFFNNTLSVFKFQDANGAFPRADETVDLDAGGGAAGVGGIEHAADPRLFGGGALMVVQHAKAKIATLVGFAIACLLIFLYLFQAAGGHLGFGSRYTVSAVMPVTFNLVPNSDVRVAGVKVGSVDSVTPDGQNARVTFSIDTKTGSFPPIYRNATTQVRVKTLVGESYLSLDPGTPSAGKLPGGGVLPVSRAIEAVPLDQVLGMLDPATREAVRRDMAGLGAGLNGNGARLNNLFGSLPATVSNGGQLFEILDPERQQLASLINDSGQVMQALGQRTSQFQSLVVDAKATAQAVASRAGEVRQTLDQLPGTLAQARQTVADLGGLSQRATPVFGNLRIASADLSPAIEQLGPTAAQARVLFRELKPFLVALAPMVTQLRPAASTLKRTVLPLDAVLRQANPALAYLSSYSKEFGSFFSNVNAITDTKDGLGYRGRVFAMAGIDQFTDLSSRQRKLLEAMLKGGTFGMLTGTRANPYPEPGSAGSPGPASNYQRVRAAP